jgi:HEPN domain-containing protein
MANEVVPDAEPNERKFTPVLQQWLQKGNDDLRSVEYLSTMHHPTPDEVICFHCQQSAEKYLKGFLFLHDVDPPKIHDLFILLKMCEKHNEGFSVLLPKIYILRAYAVIPRYPNELEITGEDIKPPFYMPKTYRSLS